MIYSQFAYILLFIIAGLLMLTVILLVAKWLRPSNPSEQKLTTYESGEETVGSAVVNFGSKYYIIALVFILFEVELVLLFPWSTVFGSEELMNSTNGTWGWFTLTEMAIFIAVLALGLVYAWAQGFLDWIKPEQSFTKVSSEVPQELYDKINEKYS